MAAQISPMGRRRQHIYSHFKTVFLAPLPTAEVQIGRGITPPRSHKWYYPLKDTFIVLYG